MTGKTEINEIKGAGASGGEIRCPRCNNTRVWRNGRTGAKKQGYRCRDCGRSFVLDPGAVPQTVKVMVDRMIVEKIAAPIIARVVEGYASRRWVYHRKRQRATDVR